MVNLPNHSPDLESLPSIGHKSHYVLHNLQTKKHFTSSSFIIIYDYVVIVKPFDSV